MRTELQQNLAHVFWLGGSACAGKTTLTNLLGARLREHTIYHCDQAIGAHLDQADPIQHPALTAAAHLSWEALLGFSDPEFLDFILQVYREEFPLIIAGLLQLPNGRPIIAEGINLLPDLVAPICSEHHAIFLIATPEHYRSRQPLRPDFHERIQTCPNPEAAQESYSSKDLTLAHHILTRCQALNQKTMIINTDSNIEKNLEILKNHFGL